MHQDLAVRSYSPVEQTHSHHFHQVVVPLQGALDISLDRMQGALSSGQGVVIKKNVEHSFSASKDACFLVADIYDLPKSIEQTTNPTANLTNELISFCSFAQIQLQRDTDIGIKSSMIDIFKRLLAVQVFQPNIDPRIVRALVHIASDISKDYALAELASVSALSVSQFKHLFIQSMGLTAGKYLLKLRMEHALTVLRETNTPISIVAESSGYKNQSAFARRFREYYGEPPSWYRK